MKKKFHKLGNKAFQSLILLSAIVLSLFFLIALGNVVWRGLETFPDLLMNPEIGFAVRLSLFTSITATLICVLFALPAAYGLERFRIPFRRFLTVVLNIPLSLPPLVSGVALLLLLGNTGFGEQLSRIGLQFVFSVKGIVLAQFFIITPYMIKVLRSAIAEIDPKLEFVARTLGCSQRQAFFRVTLPLCRNGLFAGIIISWSRAIGEFGCSLMIAGATRMHTETLPVALYLNMSVGNLSTAMGAAVCLILISVVSMLIFETSSSFRKKQGRLE